MAFWLLKKKTETNKTEQIRERARLLNIIVKGCVSHPAFEGDGPTLNLQNMQRCQRNYLALRSFDKMFDKFNHRFRNNNCYDFFVVFAGTYFAMHLILPDEWQNHFPFY